MQKTAIGVLCVLVTMMLSACGLAQASSTEVQTTQEEENTQEQEELTAYSYLTGLPVTETVKNERPLAVMLNNIKEGCPQSGTEDAAIIYEAPVEGRITRLMGIFEDYDNMENGLLVTMVVIHIVASVKMNHKAVS